MECKGKSLRDSKRYLINKNIIFVGVQEGGVRVVPKLNRRDSVPLKEGENQCKPVADWCVCKQSVR